MNTATDTNHRSTSEILLSVVSEHKGERMSLQDIINGLAERSFGFLLLLFGLASAVAPPGVATLTAIPLIFFGLQMVGGAKTAWLPASIAKRDFNRADLEKTVKRGIPIMRFFEKFCRPRLLFMTGPLAERFLGLLIFILALVIAAPGPLTNAPPGIAIAFLSIAIINRDGLLVMIGVLISVGALYLGGLGLYLVVVEVLPWLWQHAQEYWKQVFP